MQEELDEFYEIAKQTNKERKTNEFWHYNSIEFKAKCVMTDFSVWCRLNKKDYSNEKHFKEFLTAESQDLDFWVRKYISEHYWNYNYRYDYNANKWKHIKKV